MKSFTLLFVCAFILLCFSNSFSQNPQYYNYNTTTGGNNFPFSVVAGKVIQWIYLPGELNQPTVAPSGNITKIYFRCATATRTFTNLTVKMGQADLTTLPTGVFYTGQLDTFHFSPSIEIVSVQGEWIGIELHTPFSYDSTKSLIIEVNQCGTSATGMSIYNTTLSGVRRTFNQTAGGCNYIYQGQGTQLANLGLDIEQPPPPFGPESEMSLVHTPGNFNLGAYNTGNIGKQSITPFAGPGILWNGVDGCFTGGTIWGRTTTGSVNGNMGSFTGHNDLRNVASNFAGGFTSDANFNQITTAIITDSAAPTPYGINVIQKTYSNTSEEYVFVRYGFINSTGSAISDMYSGIFVDWDINEATYTTNSGGYAPDRNMVYNFNVGAVQPYFGIGALDGPSGWRTTTLSPTPTIRQGSFNWITTLDPSTTFPPGDYRTWVGQSVSAIPPGDTSWVTFAFVGGGDLNTIRQYMADAHLKAFNLGWIPMVGINPVSNEIPNKYKLEQNYPNPFNPSTYINFSIPEQGLVTLKVYDLLGKEVTTLVNEVTNAGTYSVPFDASKFSSGVYYYRIESGSFVDSKKMMLIK